MQVTFRSFVKRRTYALVENIWIHGHGIQHKTKKGDATISWTALEMCSCLAFDLRHQRPSSTWSTLCGWGTCLEHAPCHAPDAVQYFALYSQKWNREENKWNEGHRLFVNPGDSGNISRGMHMPFNCTLRTLCIHFCITITTRKSWPNQQKINRSVLFGALQWLNQQIFNLFVKTNNFLLTFCWFG